MSDSAALGHPLGRLESWMLALVALVGVVAGRTYPVWRDHLYVACPAWNIFGIPCPTCGATRAVAAVFQGDLGAAFAWNPLAAVLALGAVVAVPLGVAAGLDWISRPAIPTRLSVPVRVLFAAALVLNWAYLLAAFPG